MTFDLKNRLITTFNSKGTQIRKGKFEIQNWGNGKRNIPSIDGSQTSWALGTLHTDEGAILWPFEINWRKNDRPACPTDFEIMQLNANQLKLIEVKPGTGGWGEATWCSGTISPPTGQGQRRCAGRKFSCMSMRFPAAPAKIWRAPPWWAPRQPTSF